MQRCGAGKSSIERSGKFEMKVLVIVDVYGWVFKFFAREVGRENRRVFDEGGWCWSVRAEEYDIACEQLR